MDQSYNKEPCKDCYYWQDFSDRIYAAVSDARSDMVRNTIELRKCRFKVHPGVSVNFHNIYTDCEYSCNEFRKAEE